MENQNSLIRMEVLHMEPSLQADLATTMDVELGLNLSPIRMWNVSFEKRFYKIKRREKDVILVTTSRVLKELTQTI